jgi:hypothetical protein
MCKNEIATVEFIFTLSYFETLFSLLKLSTLFNVITDYILHQTTAQAMSKSDACSNFLSYQNPAAYRIRILYLSNWRKVGKKGVISILDLDSDITLSRKLANQFKNLISVSILLHRNNRRSS